MRIGTWNSGSSSSGSSAADHAPVRRSTWRSRLDPLTIGWFLVAAAVYSLQGFGATLARDPSLYVYGGQRVAEGSLPYVDVVNRAGPLAHAIPGLGVVAARLVGADDLTGVRVLFMLLSALSVAAVHVLGREVSGSRLGGVLAAACFLTFQGFSLYATFGPREKTAMVLFTTWALVAAARRRWVWAGVLVALATLTWQPVFFGLLAGVAAAIAVAVPLREVWRAVLRVALGGAVPTVVTTVAYAVAGELKALLDCFLLINARYTDQRHFLDDVGRSWAAVLRGYGWSTWLLVGGLVSALLVALLALARRSAPRSERAAALAVGVVVLGGAAWTLRAFDNWPDVMLLLPAAAAGAGGLVGLVLRRLPARAAVACAVVPAVAALTVSVMFSLDHRFTGLEGEQAMADAVVDVLPDARILAIEAPQPLVLTGRENISRFQLYGNGMMRYLEDSAPGGRAGFVRGLAEQEPELIAIGRPVRVWTDDLLEGYVMVSKDSQWSWYVSDQVPREQVSAVRAAVAAVIDRYGSIGPW